jgi:DNA helicase-2/ATP-dependent DNA helicase PcrA
LVETAKKTKDENVLITTYTEANEAEIRNKFKGRIPPNITIQTWFSFLLQHGVRPYQSVMNDNLHDIKIGFYLTEEKSGKKFDNKGNPIKIKNPKTGKEQPVYWGEKDFFNYYFTKSLKIYSDKISKFIVECNKRTRGEVIKRIARIYPHIYIDEIQDLAGWELEILKLFFSSESNILLVGDPRQVTYLTHHSSKYEKYKDGKIKEFITNECNKTKRMCDLDETTLQKSHRNNKSICNFSSALYPSYVNCEPCECEKCRKEISDHQGVFMVKPEHVEAYCKKYNPQKLFYQKAEYPDLNYGTSKGLGFDKVLIYPTKKIREYLINGNVTEIETIKAKFYVALTRARYSAGIVCDYADNANYIEGLKKYKVNENVDN